MTITSTTRDATFAKEFQAKVQSGIRVQATALANRLKAVMTRPAPQRARYQRRGRVDRRLIGSLATGIRDDIMVRRLMRPNAKPPRVLLAIDDSVSMRGQTNWVVGLALDTWVQALDRVGLEYAVATWGSSRFRDEETAEWDKVAHGAGVGLGNVYASYAQLTVVKGFGDRPRPDLHGKWAGVLGMLNNGGTPTHPCLLATVEYGTKGLGQDQDLLVVFFTDGAPDANSDCAHKWIRDYITEQAGYGITIVPVLFYEAGASQFNIGSRSWPNALEVDCDSVLTSVGRAMGDHVKRVVRR